MTTDEMTDMQILRLAAEGLVTHARAAERDRNHLWRLDPGDVKNMAEAGMELAEAWLAENPADDDQPVTAEWLRAVQLYPFAAVPHGWTNDRIYPVCIRLLPGGSVWVTVADHRLGHVGHDRGHVRRLLSAVGMPLAKGGGG